MVGVASLFSYSSLGLDGRLDVWRGTGAGESNISYRTATNDVVLCPRRSPFAAGGGLSLPAGQGAIHVSWKLHLPLAHNTL
jgi:hypothetical protein